MEFVEDADDGRVIIRHSYSDEAEAASGLTDAAYHSTGETRSRRGVPLHEASSGASDHW
jgi:hypothetical protein